MEDKSVYKKDTQWFIDPQFYNKWSYLFKLNLLHLFI
jgi:hypothetical protein